MAKETNTQAVATTQPDRAEIERILTKADSDQALKPAELTSLRKFLKAEDMHPAHRLAHTVTTSALVAMKSNTLTKELLRVEIQDMRVQLGEKGAPMLEVLLIDQICACYLRMWLAENRHTSRMQDGDRTITQAEYDEKALGKVQARYLRAIETLAKVRRLKLPAVQLNVAQSGANQLNMAGPNLAAPAEPVEKPIEQDGSAERRRQAALQAGRMMARGEL